VLGFCKQRGLPVDGIQIVQRMHASPNGRGLMERIELEIQVPETFPGKYHQALVRSAEQCLVKRHFDNPPKFDIHTEVVG
jgi:ribosomal protein S12 methylthiotransferase accessory factor